MCTFNAVHVALLIVVFLDQCAGVSREEVIVSQFTDICRHFEGGFDLYQSPTGEYCCQCPAGYYVAKICKENHFREPESRVCKICPFDPLDPNNQTYTASENNDTQCTASDTEEECMKYMNTHREMGNTMSNSRCVCNKGYHTASGTEDVSGGCHKNSECIEGFQPSQLATYMKDTQCQQCRNGTYSNISSSTEMCIPWTRCGASEYAVSVGNMTHDTVCSQFSVHDNVTVTIQMVGVTTLSNDDSKNVIIISVCVAFLVVGIVAAVLVYCFCRRMMRALKSISTQADTPSANNGVNHTTAFNGSQPTNVDIVNETGETASDNLISSTDQTGLQNGTMHPTNEADDESLSDEIGESEALNSDSDTGTREYSVSYTDNPQPDNDVKPVTSDSVVERVQTSENAVVETNEDPCELDKLFNEGERDKMKEKGCHDCCVQRHLKDHFIAEVMLYSLVSGDSDDVIMFLRILGLKEGAVKDIRREYHHHTQQEIRFQCIHKLIETKGTSLTPRVILESEIKLNELRECMINEFLKNLKICKSVQHKQ